jgi:hypothetical protein
MAIFRPPSTIENGNVEVMPVEAVLAADVYEGNIPFMVILNASDSKGENVSITFDGPEPIVPIEMAGNLVPHPDTTQLWIPEWQSIPVRISRRGLHTITLTVFGGTQENTAQIVIQALPPTPEESENLIIRALSITASQVDRNIIETDGDQV